MDPGRWRLQVADCLGNIKGFRQFQSLETWASRVFFWILWLRARIWAVTGSRRFALLRGRPSSRVHCNLLRARPTRPGSPTVLSLEMYVHPPPPISTSQFCRDHVSNESSTRQLDAKTKRVLLLHTRLLHLIFRFGWLMLDETWVYL